MQVLPPRLLLLLLGLASPVRGLLTVRPVSFGRLALPIYGAEHLLVLQLTGCKQEEADDLQLPLVCSYDQGSRLEAALTRPTEKPNALALAADVVQRKPFFEAASGKQLSIWDCGGLPAALKTSTLPETMLAAKTTKTPHNRLRIECSSMASTGSTTGLEFPSLERPIITNSTSPPAAAPVCACSDGCAPGSSTFSKSLARRALLDGSFASSSRARGFRVLLPVRPDAGGVPSGLCAIGSLGALRGFLFFFGGGSGELIAALASVPVSEVFPSVFARRNRPACPSSVRPGSASQLSQPRL